jgi:hypothetical protein
MQESPIYSRMYDLLLWLLPQVAQFPRAHRFGLGERITRLGLDLQDTLISAGLKPVSERRSFLFQADIQLAKLRRLLRLCKDLQVLSMGQYEHVSRMLAEIGRLLGGWHKSLVKMGQADESTGVTRGLVEQ